MRQWRQDLLAELLPELKKISERPQLWEVMFCETIPEDMNDPVLRNQHSKLEDEASHLPFYGLLAPGWDAIHSQFCKETQKKEIRNWLPMAIAKTWEHLHKAWQTLTDQMHNNTGGMNHHQQSLHYQASTLYELRARVPPHIRSIYFPNDFHHWLIHSSTITINNWLKAYGRRIRKAIATAEQRPPQTLPITAYFSPIQ